MSVIAWLVEFLYRLCALFPQRDKICFLSRQSSKPFDFELLEPALEQEFPGYAIVWACVPNPRFFGIGSMLKQVWHAATSRLCFVDGYVPAVCIPTTRDGVICIQLWHALGAIKRFGYQALDTSDGRSSKAAKILRMHRGYDVVVAGLGGAVPAFCEAFDCSPHRVLPLGLPRIDYLLLPDFEDERNRRSCFAKKIGIGDARVKGIAVALYAPTLRRGSAQGKKWLTRSVQNLHNAFSGVDIKLVVAGHPLQDEDEINEGEVSFLRDTLTLDALEWVDYVITDYSAVSFEAAIVAKRVLFYVPDIDEYRLTPGLNIDPLVMYPELSFRDAYFLAYAIVNDWHKNGCCIESFDKYIANYMGIVRPGCIERIVECGKRLVSEASDGTYDDKRMSVM